MVVDSELKTVYTFLFNCQKNKIPFVRDFEVSNKKYFVFFAYKSILIISDTSVIDEYFLEDENDEIVDFNIKNKSSNVSILIKRISSEHGKINLFEERTYDLNFELEDPISKKYSSRNINRTNEDTLEKYILTNNHLVCIDINNRVEVYDLSNGNNIEDQFDSNLKFIEYVDQYKYDSNNDEIFLLNVINITYISFRSKEVRVKNISKILEINNNSEQISLYNNLENSIIAILSNKDSNRDISILSIVWLEFNSKNENLLEIKYKTEKQLKYYSTIKNLTFKNKRFCVLLNNEKENQFVEYQSIIYGKFDKNVRNYNNLSNH